MRSGCKRELVAETCAEWDVSIRRACLFLEFDTSSYHHRSRRRDQAGIEARIKNICATRVRYGYRRIHVLLQREGWNIKLKRTYRIGRNLGLQLRNTEAGKQSVRRTDCPPKTQAPSQGKAPERPSGSCRSERFLGDGLRPRSARAGKKIRVLTVVDTFSRYVPVLDPRFNYRAEGLVRTLEKVCTRIGYPKTIRVDQGSKFVSRDLDLWATPRA